MNGQLLLEPPSPPSRHPVDVGQRTEAIVLLPFGVNHRYDLVLDLGERFLRVQCKTARIVRGCVEFNSQSVRANTKEVLCRDYRGEADLFIPTVLRTTGSMLFPSTRFLGDK